MPMHSLDQLCKVRIDLDLSKNLRLKNMFRELEFHRGITHWLRQNDLEISNQWTNPQGRVTSIEIVGSVVGVQLFIDRYLSADTLGIGYDIE